MPEAVKYHTHQTHYLRKTVGYLTRGTAVTVGVLPAGAIVVGAGAIVTTAFNGSGTDFLDIGTADDPDGFATDLDVSTKGNKVWDELATSDDLYSTSEVTVTATYADSGTDATAGSAEVYVQFIPSNT